MKLVQNNPPIIHKFKSFERLKGLMIRIGLDKIAMSSDRVCGSLSILGPSTPVHPSIYSFLNLCTEGWKNGRMEGCLSFH